MKSGKRSKLRSPYLEAFGARGVGRPPGEETLPGLPGNPQITNKARRRAMAVLKLEHRDRYEELVAAEVRFLAHEEGIDLGIAHRRELARRAQERAEREAARAARMNEEIAALEGAR